ncbi:ABC transporter substrate-binding protein [Vibrio crassostreae]|uniref:ABC transporter substrate-binding protein n=1 Tax=Vibrio crassostreae TaxID=246167 RepID=UPI0010538AE8|nr:extracellular solute-binding protein [Vibrio crassostreae]TCN98024.1 putative spermidine/putrescine transport system substrate-binding protein [Vibrio crassostreae]CAK1698612.1 putative spermidine/putrescine transport system substrate-binding protein [Vibrio crassostreae]CAK1717751.1 putative spermidine/putrescine transport system substrate-binding protein [Vibrio crassostreae]CAK1773354.1 putative spermidine/putrescine transport system substrate-binding protein [Vibrio crassostreae]CAK1874
MKAFYVSVLASSSFLAGTVYGQQNEIYLYNWDEFLSDNVIEKLSDTYGIALKQQYFSDESIRDEVLLSERRGAFELVVIESMKLKALAKQNLFHNLSDLQQSLSSNFESRWVEGCGNYGIPYAWGTSGILYRTGKVETPNSWSTLLDPETKTSGRISMYYEPTDLVSTALLANQFDPFTNNEQELRVAYKALQTQKPHLESSEYVIDYIHQPERLANIDLAYGYSGDSYALNDADPDASWAYIVPEEGTTLWLECIAAINNGELSPQATTILSFLSQPDIAAQNAMDSWFATPSSKAKALTSQEYQNDPELFPSQEVLERSYLYQQLEPNSIQIRNRIVDSLR